MLRWGLGYDCHQCSLYSLFNPLRTLVSSVVWHISWVSSSCKNQNRFLISIAKVACGSSKPQWVNKGRLLSSLNNSADWRSVNFAGMPDYLTLKVLQKGHQPSRLIYYHSKEVGCKSITTISPLGRGRLYHNRCIRHFLSPLGWPASWAFFL